MTQSSRSSARRAVLGRAVVASLIILASAVGGALSSPAASAASPTLRILAPANNAIIGNGSPVAVVFLVSDFNLTRPGTGGPPSADEGHVRVFLDGALIGLAHESTVVLTLPSGSHDIRLQLVADNGTALSPDVRASVRVTVTRGPAGGRPAISITNPTEGAARGTDLAVSFRVTNFALVPPGGPASVPNEGLIHAFVDGTFYQELASYEPVRLGLDEGRHTIRLQLVDSARRPLAPDVSASVNLTVQEGLGRFVNYLPILAYTNGALGLGILGVLLLRGRKAKR